MIKAEEARELSAVAHIKRLLDPQIRKAAEEGYSELIFTNPNVIQTVEEGKSAPAETVLIRMFMESLRADGYKVSIHKGEPQVPRHMGVSDDDEKRTVTYAVHIRW